MRQAGVAAAAGVLVGLLFGFVVPLPADDTPLRAAPVPEPVPVAASGPRGAAELCPDLVLEQEQQLDAAWLRLEQAEERLRKAESGVADLIGAPVGFDDVPEAMQPGHIEDTVLAILDEDIATLQWIDCSEAPCIAVLQMDVSDSTSLDMRRAADPLRDGLGSTYTWEWFGVESGDYMTVPLGPPTDDTQLHQRVDLREEIIIRELAGLEMIP